MGRMLCNATPIRVDTTGWLKKSTSLEFKVRHQTLMVIITSYHARIAHHLVGEICPPSAYCTACQMVP